MSVAERKAASTVEIGRWVIHPTYVNAGRGARMPEASVINAFVMFIECGECHGRIVKITVLSIRTEWTPGGVIMVPVQPRTTHGNGRNAAMTATARETWT